MGDDLILGLDVGTTTVKAAAFALDGTQVFKYTSSYPTHRRGAIVEQDPADWTRRIDEALARLRDAGLAPRIRAIGVTSQVNTHLFVDDACRPLVPAIIWQDVRSADEAAGIDRRIAEAERLRWWGAPLPVDASHALSRMAWMARHRPEIWERTHAVLLPKDYVIRQWTGEWLSDPVSNVGLVGPDLRYIPELLDLVPGAAERLPRLADPQSVAGAMRLDGAPGPVPVSVGLMDAWAGMFGTGVCRNGDAVYLSGTSEVLGVVSEAVAPVPGVLVFPRYAGLRKHAGPTQAGGASVDWFCRTFATTPEAMAAAATHRDPAGAVPLFLPHLLGERAPIWDAQARGAFLGLSGDTGAAEMAQAVYEGVAFSARLLFEALDASATFRAGTVLCGGGGFRSDAWSQTRANILGRRLRRLAVANPGVLGSAAIAAVATGLHPDLATALGEVTHYDRDFTPDPALQGFYDDVFALYRPAYEATRDLSHAMVRLRAGQCAQSGG